jgi:hypothetical protein
MTLYEDDMLPFLFKTFVIFSGTFSSGVNPEFQLLAPDFHPRGEEE